MKEPQGGVKSITSLGSVVSSIARLNLGSLKMASRSFMPDFALFSLLDTTNVAIHVRHCCLVLQCTLGCSLDMIVLQVAGTNV